VEVVGDIIVGEARIYSTPASKENITLNIFFSAQPPALEASGPRQRGQ